MLASTVTRSLLHSSCAQVARPLSLSLSLSLSLPSPFRTPYQYSIFCEVHTGTMPSSRKLISLVEVVGPTIYFWRILFFKINDVRLAPLPNVLLYRTLSLSLSLSRTLSLSLARSLFSRARPSDRGRTSLSLSLSRRVNDAKQPPPPPPPTTTKMMTRMLLAATGSVLLADVRGFARLPGGDHHSEYECHGEVPLPPPLPLPLSFSDPRKNDPRHDSFR